MSLNILDTVNTTRIPFSEPYLVSIYVSRMLWPTRNSPKIPKVIILAPDSLPPYAYMAASLVHDPIQGNEMLIPLTELPEETAMEIRRIHPEGAEGLPPVVLVGPFEQPVVDDIRKLGYETLLINGRNVFLSAAEVARIRKEITPESQEGPVSLFMLSIEEPFGTVPVPYYSTHSGVPILFTRSDRLPKATVDFLREFSDNVVYVVENQNTISDEIIDQISNLVEPSVRRIAGRNSFQTAIEFSTYFDPETGLGWNRNKKGRGDAFAYSNIERWDLGVAAANLAHHGKHTPLLLVKQDELPESVKDYLDFLRPPAKTPPMPPFMHNFIIGEACDIAFRVQGQINNHTLEEPM